MSDKEKTSLNNPSFLSSKTKKNSGQFWTIIAVLVLAIFLVVSYKLKDILKPNAAVTVALDESCDLRAGACVSELPSGGKVSLSISPNDIPILRPLALQVKTEGVVVSNIEVDFIGIGMEMGYNRSKLEVDQEEANKNQFSGKAVLPVCSRSKMDWEARVLLKTDDGLVMVPFRFFTNK